MPMSEVSSDLPPAVKDENDAYPIAGSWLPMLRDVVRRFVAGDYGLEERVLGVEPVSSKTAEHVRSSIANYGATWSAFRLKVGRRPLPNGTGRIGTFGGSLDCRGGTERPGALRQDGGNACWPSVHHSHGVRALTVANVP